MLLKDLGIKLDKVKGLYDFLKSVNIWKKVISNLMIRVKVLLI